MIKIVFDGNPEDGYSIHTKVPCLKTSPHELESNLIVTDAATLAECLPTIRQVVLDTEGYDIFEQEFVIVHEDSSFEPGPHPDGLEHYEPLVEEDTLGVGAFNPEQQAGVISAAQQVFGHTPHPDDDKDTLGVGAPSSMEFNDSYSNGDFTPPNNNPITSAKLPSSQG